MARRCRIGVVGCGFFAQNHLHSWKSLAGEGAELVAVCDLSEEQAKAAARSFSVPAAYTDMADMISNEALDLVDIVTQVNTHQTLVSMALDAGIATIVQKPFGLSLAQCQEMLAQSRATGQFLAVHENFRFQHPHVMIREILSEGRIGDPTWGRISFRTGYDIYAGQPYLRAEERFIVTDVGVHVLDLARVFFGEVRHLSAELQRRNPDVKGEDTATMTLRHRSGAVSVVECTYGSRQQPDPFPVTLIEIEGTTGALRLDADLKLSISSGGTTEVIDTDAPVLDWAERPWHVVQHSVQVTCHHILECWLAGVPASISAEDNIKTYALCDAAYRAATEGRNVRPECERP
ncbi:Gfo/Idh/MocA family protein [Sulfitobacter sp. JB4-11]|uniref:Gfo/Idh/MocA family protein n=1 Tax=Sulfitobacter rhodophyticola TaxID=3238304 RepID=UPI003512FEF6